jgi:tetratricopeptide (TPR) repeat protein
MIYDWENTPVNGVSVFINGQKYVESDIQGRFVLEFKKNGEYAIKLEKSGYEIIENAFTYDPMNVLYFKMANASQLLTEAENALDQRLYEEAETYLERALKLEPFRPDIRYLKSILLYLQNRKDEAKEILDALQGQGISGDSITNFRKKMEQKFE